MKDKTNKNFWERFAFLYTPFMKKNHSSYKELCEIISKYLEKDMSVLELACGTGQLTFLLADRVKSWEATDFSEKMIEAAKKQSVNGNISFSVQDATNLTYSEKSFDVVIIANALHIMPNPEMALTEIYKVLKPNGLLFAPTFVYEGKIPKTIWFMEKIGLRTFHKWNSNELYGFIQEHKFNILERLVIKGGLLPECMIVGMKPINPTSSNEL